MENDSVVFCVNDVKKIGAEGVLRETVDVPRYQKKRKTRRGRAKKRNSKPYSKPTKSYLHEKRQDHGLVVGLGLGLSQEKEQVTRPANEGSEMFIHGQPVAPYNTTQFLMDDHNSFPDLDVQLQAVGLASPSNPINNLEMPGVSIPNKRFRPGRPRARDSSFSVETDDGYFYSSPEDEGEFLTKEFSNTYEDLHAERLGSLSKSQLIQEYVQLEGKVSLLEKKMQEMDADKMGQSCRPSPSSSDEAKHGTIGLGLSDRSLTRSLDDLPKKVFQEDMNKLSVENERLARENEQLRHMCRKVGLCVEVLSVSSSIDSESDSSSSSYNSNSIGESSNDSDSDRTINTPSKDTEMLPSDPSLSSS